ncbi:MAG: phenylalanine--tRNA ligase subunit beta [Nitrospirae bacterium]|nr:phenylalanine--tRNA ligase subunit beta [Nitrospirota bacterium]
MRASINWLKEFVDFSLTHREIANTLTMAGLEVEGLEEIEGDTILEVSVTPNRADCLSIKGIAREISSILSLPLKDVAVTPLNEEGEPPSINIKTPQLCRRYASRIIRGVKVGSSPQWISKRLESHGMRLINNIVDITNYVLLETGQPLHAFDLNKLAGGCIIVNTAQSVNKLLTLDGEERALNSDMLLIWDKEKPVAIAGVMGGLTTEVTSSSVDILLESAFFNPISVRRTSKTLNLITESSYRFERGVDIEGIVYALNRAAQLILETAGGKASKLIDKYPKPFTPKQIHLKLSKVNKIIGINISSSEVQDILGRLGFKNKKKDEEEIIVTPPSFRQDIIRDVDIIEEIARLYGYDKIPPTFPVVRLQPVGKNIRRGIIATIRDSMRRSGYSEVINYSFLNPAVFDKLRLPSDDKRRDMIKIRNPLRKEEASLRTTLIPSLIDNVSFNIKRGEKSVRFFEVSRVFSHSGQKLPEESMRLAGAYLNMPLSLWQGKHEGFYDLKGAIESLFLELRIGDYSFTTGDICEQYLHPGKSCTIKIGSHNIGSLGVLHPAVSQAFDITGDITVFELDLERVLSYIPADIIYKQLPKYPYVERDISIVVTEDIKVSDVNSAILSVSSDIIESVVLFDIYTGHPIPKGKKSLAFAIRYRAKNRTLTDSEVDAMHSKILNVLENSFKAELRS